MQCLSVIQKLVGVGEGDHKLCQALLERLPQFFQLFFLLQLQQCHMYEASPEIIHLPTV